MGYEIGGLSESQVIERRGRGQGNVAHLHTGRTYLQILRKNLFTFINTVLFAISIVLIVMGKPGDALVTAGLVLMNVVVGVFQEARAKRKLDQIALLARPTATVIRDGQEKGVDPSEVVLGDLLVVRPGDQIVVDGQVVGKGRLETDESLLTGESEQIPKRAGDPVYSGSFCVNGMGLYEAQKVGADSLINQLTASARAFRQSKTPLQREIDLIIRTLTLLAALLGFLFGLSWVMGGVPLVEGLRMAAVIVALVPQGLFLMTTVAYAMGAVRVAGKGALIQESSAVESIGNVNMLCLDKTGTLTTNRLHLHAISPVAGTFSGDEAWLKQILGDYGASVSGANRTTIAIAEDLAGQRRLVDQEVPFTSERKWSALTFDDPALRGTYVLGAPEIVRPCLKFDTLREGSSDVPGLDSQADEWVDEGLRVLFFAYQPDHAPLYGAQGEPQLPGDLVPLSLLSFRDELRPEAQETLQHFSELGIGFKIISGDHPRTVVALLRQLGFAHADRAVSGLDLQAVKQAEMEKMVGEATVLGRVTPQQKEDLVRLLQKAGHYVAMIGDGVNDVLSLKQANVGIAMRSGSQATRSVADVVLLQDSFAVLPAAFREGQRILKGMEDVIRLLLTRTLYVMFLIVAARLVGAPFPVTPKHNSVLALLTVGIPILAIAAWARPGPTPRSMIRSTSHFVLPAAVTIAVVSLGVYLCYWGVTGDLGIAQTALTTATVLCGLLLLPFVEPPTEAWVGGDVLSGDWRPTVLAVGMLALYGVILAVPPLRTFFELTPLRLWDYLLIGALVAGWALLLRFVWRVRLFEHLSGDITV